MPRCARPGCDHRRFRHKSGTGPCKIMPWGHCIAYIAPGVEPPPTPSPEFVYMPGQRAQVPNGTVEVPAGASVAAAIKASGYGKRYLLGGDVEVPSDFSIPGDVLIMPEPGLAMAKIVGTGAHTLLQGSGFIELDQIDLSGAKRDTSLSTVDSGRGIEPGGGCRVSRSLIHGNANQGIGSGGGTVYAQATVFELNGLDAFFNSDGTNRSAAGIKRKAGSVVSRDNVYRANGWVGLWFDYNSSGVIDSDGDEFYENWGKGVSYEKSGGKLLLHHAKVQRNNTHNQKTGGGITSNGSRGIDIAFVEFGENSDGSGGHRAINIIKDARAGGYDPQGTIFDLTLNGDRVEGCDFPGIDCGRFA